MHSKNRLSLVILVISIFCVSCSNQQPEKNKNEIEVEKTQSIPLNENEIEVEKTQSIPLNENEIEVEKTRSLSLYKTEVTIRANHGYYYLVNENYITIPMSMDIPRNLNENSVIFDINDMPRLFQQLDESDYIEETFLWDITKKIPYVTEYSISEKEDYYEIISPEIRSNGQYCFVEGPYFEDKNNISWCFIVIDPSCLHNVFDEQAKDENLNELLAVKLQDNLYGAYVVSLESENGLIELPPVDANLCKFDDSIWNKSFSPSDFVKINTDMPIILIRSNKLQFIDFL